MDVAVVSLFLAMLALATLLGAGALVGGLLGGRALLDARSATWIAFLVAATATLGSLYYSEVAGFEPCRLCWYQRIAMYPLVPVLGLGALRRDEVVWRYGLALAVIGLPLAVYHYLLQLFPSLSTGACSASVPCNAAYVWEFGFVSIPFMAGAGFIAISSLLLVARKAST